MRMEKTGITSTIKVKKLPMRPRKSMVKHISLIPMVRWSMAGSTKAAICTTTAMRWTVLEQSLSGYGYLSLVL